MATQQTDRPPAPTVVGDRSFEGRVEVRFAIPDGWLRNQDADVLADALEYGIENTFDIPLEARATVRECD